jgi:hypothetical protein
MKKHILSAMLVGIIATGLTSVANAGWISASNGSIPSGSLVSGHEAGGEKLYLCRANYKGGVHPGKVRTAFGACNIGWGDNEVAVKEYETYVIWQKATDGEVPASAIVGGAESSGEKLYVCRGNHEGGVHSGKVRKAFGACNISWGGKEVKVNPYEVLIN